MSYSRHIVYTYNVRTVEQKYIKNREDGRNLPRKIAIMVISLIKESTDASNKEIEEEILKELKELRIPWMEKVEKVTVLESNEN